MDYVNITGIDPGLVHTGAVNMCLDPASREFSIVYQVFDGVTPAALDEVAAWAQEHWAQETFIEAYRPRSHFSADARMGEAVSTLRRSIPRARSLDNTGVIKVIKPELMRLLGVWSFDQATHHQDLRSAARIGLYGLVKNPDYNRVLATLVMDHLDNRPWSRV